MSGGEMEKGSGGEREKGRIVIRQATKDDHERILEFCTRDGFLKRVPTEWGMGLVAERKVGRGKKRVGSSKKIVESSQNSVGSSQNSVGENYFETNYEDEETVEIVGFVNICMKPFVEPLVIHPKLNVVEKVHLVEDMLNVAKGIAISNNMTQVYFTAGNSKETVEGFVKFLRKVFNVEMFTDEDIYIGKV